MLVVVVVVVAADDLSEEEVGTILGIESFSPLSLVGKAEGGGARSREGSLRMGKTSADLVARGVALVVVGLSGSCL